MISQREPPLLPRTRRREAFPRLLRPALALAPLLLSPARPARGYLDAGRPACDYCRMILGDDRFGARAWTRRGESRIYDSIECMAAAVLTDSLPAREIRRIEVVRHDAPGKSVAVGRATLLRCPGIESPMGLSIAAFGSKSAARAACRDPAARRLDWRGVLEQVNATWFQGKLDPAAHARLPAGRRD